MASPFALARQLSAPWCRRSMPEVELVLLGLKEQRPFGFWNRCRVRLRSPGSIRAGEVVRGTDYGNDRREVKVIRRRPSSWEKRQRTDERRKGGCVAGSGTRDQEWLVLPVAYTDDAVEWPLVRS